ESRADLVGNLAEALDVNGARIGRAPADDQLRRVRLREPPDFVWVNEPRLRINRVVDAAVQPRRDMALEPVRQVSAVLRPHRQERVARLQTGEEDGEVCGRPRQRLHVRVLRAEERLRPLDCQLLELVDDLAAAEPGARIAVPELVRKDAPKRMKKAWP